MKPRVMRVMRDDGRRATVERDARGRGEGASRQAGIGRVVRVLRVHINSDSRAGIF